MDTWPAKWVQSILQSSCQRFDHYLHHHGSSITLEGFICNKVILVQHLETVIRARIPSITSLINKSIDELESEMDHLGRPIAVDAGVSIV